jgi:5-oxoprolinase (ATP-hydrolysing) subunit A
MRVDLNTDAGESFGAWALGDDAALFSYVTSVNVACGFHAGDPSVIRRTIRLAAEAGVCIGAHPGYPDLQGFGRRAMAITPREVEDLVLYQVAALLGMTRAEGVRLAHVKPHGALYTQAARDPAVASPGARGPRGLFVDPGCRRCRIAQRR